MRTGKINVAAPVAVLFTVLVLCFGPHAAETAPEEPSKDKCPEGVEEASYDRSQWPGRLVMAFITIGTDKETLERYKPLTDFLSCRMGIEVSPVVAPDYQQVYGGFAKKRMDAAYMGPMSYVELGDYAEIEPVVKELDKDGEAGDFKESRNRRLLIGRGFRVRRGAGDQEAFEVTGAYFRS